MTNPSTPLPELRRHTGVLLHVTSLPGGQVGSFGESAFALIDQLADAGCDRWQMLPLSPPDHGGSPYSSVGAFAISRLFIDRPALAAQGLIREPAPAPHAPRVDYGAALAEVDAALDEAWATFLAGGTGLEAEVEAAAETVWMRDFARFTARLRVLETDAWWAWPEAAQSRDEARMAAWDGAHPGAVERVLFEQVLVAQQWARVREHAAARGVGLVGDIPIFVAGGSADVWANQELFDLDEAGLPIHVAGVPPDYFSETGQLWGNPLYDWDAMEASHFGWWTERFRLAFERFDEVRVDHFRGFEAFWQVPRDHETAMNGRWVKAPGAALFDHLVATLGPAYGDTGDARPPPDPGRGPRHHHARGRGAARRLPLPGLPGAAVWPGR